MALALAYALSQSTLPVNRDTDEFGLLSTLAQGTTTLLAPLGGLVLGLAVFWRESRPEIWGFLVHRPAARSGIFWTKALVGASLYLLATVLPFALAALWCAAPGRLPFPFDPAMALPGLADILHGLAYFFAAALVALRPARWYASRLLPLGLPLVSSVLLYAVPEFWHALLVIAGVLACTLPAARGAFLCRADYPRQPRWAKTGLALSLLAGLAVSAGVLFSLLDFAAETLLPSARPITRGYDLLPDGTLVVLTYGLSGEPLVTDRHGQSSPELTARYSTRNWHRSHLYISPAWMNYITQHRYRNPGRFFELAYVPADRNERWYFIHKTHSLFVYDTFHHRLVGAVGPRGFAPGQFRATPGFDLAPLRSTFLPGTLVFPDALYRIAPGSHDPVRLWAPPPGDAIEAVSGAPLPAELAAAIPIPQTSGLPYLPLLATRNQILALDTTGRVLFQTPRLMSDPTSILFAPLKKDGPPEFALLYQAYWPSGLHDNRLLLTFVNADGQLLRREEIPPLPLLRPGSPAQTLTVSVLPPLAGLVQPLAAVLVAWGVDLLNGQTATREFLAHPTFNWSLGLNLAAMLLGLLLAVALVQGLASRYAWPRRRRLVWSLVAVFLGLGSILLIICLYEFPARLPCPACRRPRPVSHPHCPRCAAPWPPPPPNGTEVFA